MVAEEGDDEDDEEDRHDADDDDEDNVCVAAVDVARVESFLFWTRGGSWDCIFNPIWAYLACFAPGSTARPWLSKEEKSPASGDLNPQPPDNKVGALPLC